MLAAPQPPPGALDLLVTAPRHLGRLLALELEELGATRPRAAGGAVRVRGDLELAYRICLWSRLGGRVLLGLLSTELESAGDLYEAVRAFPWTDHLGPEQTFAVDASAAEPPPGSDSTAFLALRVKDAVADRLRELAGRRPSVQRSRPDLRLHLRVSGRRASLYLDLAGESLHRRGYREQGGAAPLRENLAAGLLRLAGWREAAAQGWPLLDPMCGSGTLLIEAALLAADRAPGLGRDYFGFLGWRGHQPALWRQLLEEARGRAEAGSRRSLPLIIGYDVDAGVLSKAHRNLKRAGLAGRVRLEARPLVEACPPAEAPGPGLLVCNPPYGERLDAAGGQAERGEKGRGTEARWGGLRPLYTSLGDLLKRRFTGWRAYLLSGNAELTRYLGLRAAHGWSVWNGPIPCKLLEYPIVAREQPDRADGAHPTGTGPGDRADQSGGGAQAFANRLRKNARHRGRWARRQGITCYRLYDADIPEYAVAIDRYERWVVVQEYAPPAEVAVAAARRRLRQVLSVVPEVLGLSPADLRLKVRHRQRRGCRYGRLGASGELHEVHEGGHRFLVNLDDHLDTGLFLDHRPTRALIGELAAGGSFLNLFAYTGTATVYAARGGATGTVSVDLSATYLDWARRNLELNGLRGPRHELIRADCLEWMKSCRRRFDLIFLDPPTFSNSKAMRGTLDVQRDHVALIRAATRLLAPGGLLLFGCNARRFRLARGELVELSVRDITGQSVPPDFARNPPPHRLFRIEVKAHNAGGGAHRGGQGSWPTTPEAAAAGPGERW